MSVSTESVNNIKSVRDLRQSRTFYIAGKMRGVPQFNFPAFDEAAKYLRSLGHFVISPAELDRQIGFDPATLPIDHDWNDIESIGFSLADAIHRDTEALKKCNAIFMLDGWEQSTGARAEKALAEWMGLEVFHQSDCNNCDDGRNLKDGDTITNAAGGKQSHISARFDCIPPEVLRLLAMCLGFGARKYGKDNWRKIDIEDNLAHAMNHVNEWRRGDRHEPHLVNAMARITFALAQAVESGEQSADYVHPESIGA